MAKKSKYYIREDGLHECIRRIDGKRVAFRGKTDREVDQKILAYHTERETLKAGRLFSEVSDAWEREHFQKIAHGTQVCYAPALKRANEEFGQMRMRDITPLSISEYVKRLEKKGYSAQTVKVGLVVIRLICGYAVIHGDLDLDPTEAVSLSRGLPRAKRDGATDEQIALIQKAAGVPFGLFAYLLLFTGLRRGEALALRYEDIDRDAKTAAIEKKLIWIGNKPKVDDFTKTVSGMRMVVLPDKLLEKIPKGRGFIFEDGGKVLTQTEFRHRWNAYCREAGLTISITKKETGKDGKEITRIIRKNSLTPHQLRHSYATILYDAGIDTKMASQLLGHAKESTTRDIYTDITKRREKLTADAINAFVETV